MNIYGDLWDSYSLVILLSKLVALKQRNAIRKWHE